MLRGQIGTDTIHLYSCLTKTLSLSLTSILMIRYMYRSTSAIRRTVTDTGAKLSHTWVRHPGKIGVAAKNVLRNGDTVVVYCRRKMNQNDIKT